MKHHPLIQVKDVMKTQIDFIDGMTTIKEALDMMKHQGNKSLIVNKRNENDEYGILMIADIARKVLAKDRSPERVNTYEIMAKPVISVQPDMDIRYCARLFDQFHLSRCPVITGGKVVGIVSLTDMVLNGLRKVYE